MTFTCSSIVLARQSHLIYPMTMIIYHFAFEIKINTNECPCFIFRTIRICNNEQKMVFTQSLGTLAATIALCLFVVNLNIETCSSQQMNAVSEYNSNSRGYTPDTGLLDFVYHNHEDMTRFLR